MATSTDTATSSLASGTMEPSLLLTELESLAENPSELPSPIQMYNIGNLLYRISWQSKSQRRNHEDEQVVIDSDLFFSFQHLVECLPESYWTSLIEVYLQAVKQLVTTPTTQPDELSEAAQALSGLWANSTQLCQWSYSKSWLAILSQIYDKLVLQEQGSSKTYPVLSSISFLILDGLLSGKSKGDSTSSIEEEILHAIQAIEDESTDCLGDLQRWQKENEPFQRSLEKLVRKLGSNGEDTSQQREYILSMLETSQAPKESTRSAVASAIAASSTKTASKNPPKTKSIAPVDEIERRIQQIKQILPDFGEGFLETALSLHRGDVESTISTLLNDPSEYPQALRVVDKNLPRRKKKTPRPEEEAEEAAKARQLVKERVAQEQAQEEERYQALVYVQDREDQEAQRQRAAANQNNLIANEYDDDYDDQYDEIDAQLGGADEGLYDFEQVKLYNQLVREDEAEDSFWEENRNTNRAANNPKGKEKEGKNGEESEDNGQKQYRGPDKIKGGRIIGPDGKIVRKPGGARGKKNKGGNKGGGPNNGNSSAAGNSKSPPNSGNAPSTTKGKPRTKPKSQNRVNRQRDKKQKAQGNFGQS